MWSARACVRPSHLGGEHHTHRDAFSLSIVTVTAASAAWSGSMPLQVTKPGPLGLLQHHTSAHAFPLAWPKFIEEIIASVRWRSKTPGKLKLAFRSPSSVHG